MAESRTLSRSKVEQRGRNASESSAKRRSGGSATVPAGANAPSVARGVPVLRVLSGHQKHAETVLKPGTRVLVGTAATDDIRLLVRANQPSAQAVLRLEKKRTAIVPLQGGAWLDGKPLPLGLEHPIRPYQVITLAGVSFALGHAGSSKWARLVIPDLFSPYESESDSTTGASFPVNPPPVMGRLGLRKHHWGGIGLITIGLIFLGSGLWLQQDQDIPSPVDLARVPIATAPLATPATTRNNPAASTPASTANNDNAAPEQLAAAVQQVFELHRVPVETMPLDSGRVLAVIEGRHEDAARRAARSVLTDLPNVREVVIETSDRPDVTTQKPMRSVINHQTRDTGQRSIDQIWLGEKERIVQLRIGEVRSMLLTSGQRYFEGAVLPSGFALTKISEHQVQVSKNGGSRWIDIKPWLADGATITHAQTSGNERPPLPVGTPD